MDISTPRGAVMMGEDEVDLLTRSPGSSSSYGNESPIEVLTELSNSGSSLHGAGPSAPKIRRIEDEPDTTEVITSESDVDDSEEEVDDELKMFHQDMENLAPQTEERIGPLYPLDENSFVLFRSRKEMEYDPVFRKDGFVPVVVDPELSKDLMQKQKNGVQFMWDRFNEGKGCILAHETGLGKTFTCIALIKTLLEQSKNCVRVSQPALSKVVVVTKKHLVSVWDEEFKKWSRAIKRVRTFCKKEDTDIIRNFCTDSNKVLIISYEVIKKHMYFFMDPLQRNAAIQNQLEISEDLDNSILDAQEDIHLDIELLICDEVQQLKNITSQVSQALNLLPAKVKIGVTATPVQNSLLEFCTLIHFVEPGVLYLKTGRTAQEFEDDYLKPFNPYQLTRKNYVLSEDDLNLLNDIKGIVEPILQIHNGDVKVVKHDIILICNLSATGQLEWYKRVAAYLAMKDIKKKTFWYAASRGLRNICNHPCLAKSIVSKYNFPEHLTLPKLKLTSEGPFGARKIQLICVILQAIRSIEKSQGRVKVQDQDKVVIVSYSTQLLNFVEKALDMFKFKYSRFDGGTKEKDRADIRKSFNDKHDDTFVFLLSSKAGGTGISLTGANHLFILDPDWNPANDEQAMGRIWREGQVKPCFIYRLLHKGTVEEIMFNRQLSKCELKSYLTDKSHKTFNVIPEEVKALYKYHETDHSLIHDNMNCTKCGSNQLPGVSSAVLAPPSVTTNSEIISAGIQNEVEEDDGGDSYACGISSLTKWAHYKDYEDVPQEVLPTLSYLWEREQHKYITFAFHKTTDPSERVNNVNDAIHRIIGTPLRDNTMHENR